MSSRKIADLTPELQEKYREFAARMAQAGLDFIVTCTYRTQAEQDILYAQGRTTPGLKVTWTKHSKHNERRAFDIVIMRNGKPVWDIAADTNCDGRPDYDQAGQIGESCGLKWGGRFKNADRPHFEI